MRVYYHYAIASLGMCVMSLYSVGLKPTQNARCSFKVHSPALSTLASSLNAGVLSLCYCLPWHVCDVTLLRWLETHAQRKVLESNSPVFRSLPVVALLDLGSIAVVVFSGGGARALALVITVVVFVRASIALMGIHVLRLGPRS